MLSPSGSALQVLHACKAGHVCPFLGAYATSCKLNPVSQVIFSQAYEYYHLHEPAGELPELNRDNDTTEDISFKARTGTSDPLPILAGKFSCV